MKVEIISENSHSDEVNIDMLQTRINNFIKDKKVIDIKYCTHTWGTYGTTYSALIMYEKN